MERQVSHNSQHSIEREQKSWRTNTLQLQESLKTTVIKAMWC